MNTMLCLVLVVMIIIHIITMMSCGSRTRTQIHRVLTEKQLVDSEAHSFIGGCISDMTLVTAVVNENSNWSGWWRSHEYSLQKKKKYFLHALSEGRECYKMLSSVRKYYTFTFWLHLSKSLQDAIVGFHKWVEFLSGAFVFERIIWMFKYASFEFFVSDHIWEVLCMWRINVVISR